jgi:hypothetical protein
MPDSHCPAVTEPGSGAEHRMDRPCDWVFPPRGYVPREPCRAQFETHIDPLVRWDRGHRSVHSSCRTPASVTRPGRGSTRCFSSIGSNRASPSPVIVEILSRHPHGQPAGARGPLRAARRWRCSACCAFQARMSRSRKLLSSCTRCRLSTSFSATAARTSAGRPVAEGLGCSTEHPGRGSRRPAVNEAFRVAGRRLP